MQHDCAHIRQITHRCDNDSFVHMGSVKLAKAAQRLSGQRGETTAFQRAQRFKECRPCTAAASHSLKHWPAGASGGKGSSGGDPFCACLHHGEAVAPRRPLGGAARAKNEGVFSGATRQI
jgi:hypothetical protein